MIKSDQIKTIRSSHEGWGQVDAWLESPRLVLLTESERHGPTLRALIARARLAGPAVHDARVAALCQQHGVRKRWTADRDFGRFPGLKTVNQPVGR